MIADDDLMREVRGGSRVALEVLFERYRAPIWRFFRRRIRHPARAEELAQDVFVALLKNAARYEPRATFRAYLFAIAFRMLQAERRKAPQQMEPLPMEPSAPTADVDGSLWVRRALDDLGEDDREILLLREYEQLSYQEIADVCRMPLNTVRTRLFRARIALKSALMAKVRNA